MRSLLLTTSAALLILAPTLTAQLSFSAGASLPTGLSPKAIVAGDLDGDGDADMVVANSDANFLWV